MKKLLAAASLVAFLLVGCQNNSSIVEPNTSSINKTSINKDLNTKKVKANNENMGQNLFPRPRP